MTPTNPDPLRLMTDAAEEMRLAYNRAVEERGDEDGGLRDLRWAIGHLTLSMEIALTEPMTPTPDPLTVAEPGETERRGGLIDRLAQWLTGNVQPFCSKCGCPMEARWAREEGRGERYDPKTGAGVQPERLAWECTTFAVLDSFRHDFQWLPRRRDRPISGRCPR